MSHHLEFTAPQLTEDWFRLVSEVSEDPSATSREKQLARCLTDVGTVHNRLLLALHNGKITFDADGDPLDEDISDT